MAEEKSHKANDEMTSQVLLRYDIVSFTHLALVKASHEAEPTSKGQKCI